MQAIDDWSSRNLPKTLLHAPLPRSVLTLCIRLTRVNLKTASPYYYICPVHHAGLRASPRADVVDYFQHVARRYDCISRRGHTRTSPRPCPHASSACYKIPVVSTSLLHGRW